MTLQPFCVVDYPLLNGPTSRKSFEKRGWCAAASQHAYSVFWSILRAPDFGRLAACSGGINNYQLYDPIFVLASDSRNLSCLN